jgi:hypothetical protein
LGLEKIFLFYYKFFDLKLFRRIVLSLLITGGILVAAAVILGRIFEDRVTQYVVSGLNKQIRTKAEVVDVKLSFLKKFPDASLELKDVVLLSVPDFLPSDFPGQNTDTLLLAKRLYLRFSVAKLLKRQYKIKEVHIHSGMLNLLVDRQGSKNYVFWEKQKGNGTENFLLEIDNLKMTNVNVKFENQALAMAMAGNIKKGTFRGNFSRAEYNLATGMEGIIYHYSKKGNSYFQNGKISSSASLSINPRMIEVLSGDLNLAGQHLAVKGKIIRPGPLEYDLTLISKHMDLDELLRFEMIKGIQIPADLKAGGDITFQASITGMASKTQMPRIDASFSLSDGWLTASVIPYGIRELKTEGQYSNGNRQGRASTRIILRNASMIYGNSRLGGNYEVINLNRPQIDYTIKAELDLADVPSLFSVDSIFRDMEGMLYAEIHLKGTQESLAKLQKSEWQKHRYDAKFRLEGVNLGLAYKSLNLKNLTGDLTFKDHLMIKSLTGSIEDIEVSLSGRADNLLDFLLTKSGNLWLNSDVYVGRADLNKLPFLKKDNIERSIKDSVNLPDRLYIKTSYWIDEMMINKFHASQVTGELVYKPRRLSIPRLNLNSMQGQIETEGILEQQQNSHFLVKSISNVSNINITGMFTSFENFGQDFIMDKHLKGELSGLVNFSAGLDEKMKIKKETILADCDIAIQDGELSGFEPMRKLSRFINVEELEDIKFSTLTNQIFIRNAEVIIPKMDIKSSAFDITGSGLHGFDKNFTYKVKVSLSEILSRKAKKPDKSESEFGVIEDDGLGRAFIYLIIDGSDQGTDVRYDRRGAVQNIRDQFSEEKKELKEILNEEFGLFKKDSTFRGDKDVEKTGKFILDWEEDSKSEKKTDSVSRQNKSDQKRFTIVWDDDEESDSVAVQEKIRRRKKK